MQQSTVGLMTDTPFIVVVDDDQSVRQALRRLLQAARMQVETYGSGPSFLVSLQQRAPDCLILDIRMPAMTGLELRDRLVAMGRRIPIVFITAHAEDVSEQGAIGTHTEFLRKPFEDEALLSAIDRALYEGGTSRG